MSAFKELMDSVDEIVKYVFDPEKRYLILLTIMIFIGYKYEVFFGIYSKFKNKRLNEFCSYKEKAKDEIIINYLNIKIDEIISKRTTRITKHKDRNIFMFISAKINEWQYGDIILRNIIPYILVDNVIHIDFDKHKKDKRKYIIKALSWVAAMVLVIFFDFYFSIYNTVDFYYLLSLFLIGVFEIFALNSYGKIHKESDMKKYNNALVSIDISELSTKSVILPLHQHRQQQ